MLEYHLLRTLQYLHHLFITDCRPTVEVCDCLEVCDGLQMLSYVSECRYVCMSAAFMYAWYVCMYHVCMYACT